MSTLNNVFKKLESIDKVSKKVDLALVDDLKNILNGIENDGIYQSYSDSIKISSDLEVLKQKANERYNTNEKVVQASFTRIKNAEQYLATAERISKELGTDVKTIPNYNNVLNAKTKLQDVIKSLSSVQNKLKNLI